LKPVDNLVIPAKAEIQKNQQPGHRTPAFAGVTVQLIHAFHRD